jgi:hypothetical protein
LFVITQARSAAWDAMMLIIIIIIIIIIGTTALCEP